MQKKCKNAKAMMAGIVYVVSSKKMINISRKKMDKNR